MKIGGLGRSETETQDDIVEELAKKLVLKLDENKNKKNFINYNKTEKMLGNTEPVYVYFSECMRQFLLDIPIFEKVYDNCLIIYNQKLSYDHCLAILKGCLAEKASFIMNSMILKGTYLSDR